MLRLIIFIIGRAIETNDDRLAREQRQTEETPIETIIKALFAVAVITGLILIYAGAI